MRARTGLSPALGIQPDTEFRQGYEKVVSQPVNTGPAVRLREPADARRRAGERVEMLRGALPAHRQARGGPNLRLDGRSREHDARGLARERETGGRVNQVGRG